MKLMTKAIKEQLPLLYEHEDKEAKEIPVIVKYFNPTGIGTWYITEWDNRDVMFGLCCLHEAELGYVSLAELKKLDGGFGLGIERDLHYKGTLQDAMDYEFTLRG